MTDALNSFKSCIANFARWRRTAKAFASAALVFAMAASAQAADKLGSFPVDPAQVSVAGISSGAFMANQLHIAHSADIMGAAMVAGGLYGCAVEAVEDDGVRALASQAVYDCMRLPDNLKDASDYADQVKQFAAKGWIDPISNLAQSKIYFFTGGSDAVVDSQTVETGKAVYEAVGARNIVSEDRSGLAANAGHSWVTKNFGGACDANASPFIDNCGYDQAGAELKAIYGPDLKPPRKASSKRIVAFDQKEFVPEGATAANGLSDTGYLYVPKSCQPGAPTLPAAGCSAWMPAIGGNAGRNVLHPYRRERVGRRQQHRCPLSAGPRDQGFRIAVGALDYGAPKLKPRRLLELVGLRRRPALPDKKGRSGRRHLEDGRTDQGEVSERAGEAKRARLDGPAGYGDVRSLAVIANSPSRNGGHIHPLRPRGP